jgi:hypothetical protein
MQAPGQAVFVTALVTRALRSIAVDDGRCDGFTAIASPSFAPL